MTLDELVNETLTQKNRRLRQERCPHDEVYSSTVSVPVGEFSNSVCLDCGKSNPRGTDLRRAAG